MNPDQESFSLELYASRLRSLSTWEEMMKLLEEAMRVLELPEYEVLRGMALKQIGEYNRAAVGAQKARWS